MGFPCASAGKESACNVGDLGSIPGLGRSPGEGKSYLLQYSCLGNSGDKESDMTKWLSLSLYLIAKWSKPTQFSLEMAMCMICSSTSWLHRNYCWIRKKEEGKVFLPKHSFFIINAQLWSSHGQCHPSPAIVQYTVCLIPCDCFDIWDLLQHFHLFCWIFLLWQSKQHNFEINLHGIIYVV